MSGLRPRVFTKALTEEAWSSLRQVKIYSVTDFVSRDGEDTAQTPGIAYKVSSTVVALSFHIVQELCESRWTS